MNDDKKFEVIVESNGGEAAMPEWERRTYAVANWLDARLGVRFWMLAGLVMVSFFVGTPHLLIHYQCYGRCGQYATEFNCQYLGVRGWQMMSADHGKCPRVRLL